MRTLFLLPLLMLAACGEHPKSTPEPIVVIQKEYLPVVGACVPANLQPKPDYIDTDAAIIAAKDAAVRYQLVTAGRAQRNARLNEIEPVVAGCPKAK